MKFKMAKNSLFAVLLRSPWWYSALIVLGLAIAARALLPEPYVVAGIMGTFPFVVIAVMSARRQWKLPDPDRVSQALERVSTLSWVEFSKLMEKAFAAQGYAVSPIKNPAADLQLLKDGAVTLVSCKRWKAANHGVDGLKALLAAKALKEANGCTYIALGLVSDSARQFAKAEGIQLMTEPVLAQLLLKK